MKEIKHIVNDKLGVHARPAAELVKIAKSFESDIKINSVGDAKSILGVMKLALKQNDEMVITISGTDEQDAFDKITDFLKTNL
jgi:phosphocarrier protein